MARPHSVDLRARGARGGGRSVAADDRRQIRGQHQLRGQADAALAAAVDAANAGLPDYARIGPWVRARAAFSAETGLATANGRPLRAAIARLHADALGFTAAPSFLFPEST